MLWLPAPALFEESKSCGQSVCDLRPPEQLAFEPRLDLGSCALLFGLSNSLQQPCIPATAPHAPRWRCARTRLEAFMRTRDPRPGGGAKTEHISFRARGARVFLRATAAAGLLGGNCPQQASAESRPTPRSAPRTAEARGSPDCDRHGHAAHLPCSLTTCLLTVSSSAIDGQPERTTGLELLGFFGDTRAAQWSALLEVGPRATLRAGPRIAPSCCWTFSQ